MASSDRISITGHYTGSVWYYNEMSLESLVTPVGKFMYHGMQPLNRISNRLIGLDMDSHLLQRHEIIDHLLTNYIEAGECSQVLEIACGLSPRGTTFKNRYPGDALNYIEVDLPAMANRKRKVLQSEQLLNDYHQVLDCDILETHGPLSLESLFADQLDPNRPTVVITEGLVNYFPLTVIAGVWQRLTQLLKGMPKGAYISDLYPLLHDHKRVKWLQRSKKLVEFVARGEVPLHFNSHEEIEENFLNYGYSSLSIHVPEDYAQTLNLPLSSRTESIVRVIEAKV